MAAAWLGIGLAASPPARAAGVVTNCTPQALLGALSGGGTVTFTQACDITLSGTIGIATNTVINGAGHAVTIRGNNSLALFVVNSNVQFTLVGLTLTQGRSAAGGAISISSGAVVSLTNCTFTGNSALGADGAAGANGRDEPLGIGGNGGGGSSGLGATGGAIYNLGQLTAATCRFLTNSATGGNGGAGGKGGNGDFQGGNGGNGGNGGSGLGGAIYNGGNVFLIDCSFEGNTVTGGNGAAGGSGGTGAFPGLQGKGGAGAAGSGAALYSLQGAIVLNCTFSENVARGGNSAAGGTLSNGTGSNGPRGGDSLGGGICQAGVSAAVTNCTFVGNRVTAGNGGDGGPGDFRGGDGGDGGTGSGGGLYSSGTVNVVNCTFSQNGAGGGTNGVAGSGAFPGSNGSPGGSRGGHVARGAGTFVLKNSIIATNLSGGNGYGSITDAGNNISSDSSLAFGSRSFNNTDPRIGVLADNGGPTRTLALLTGSPAIDAGDTAASAPFDQRGVPRPVGSNSDIGAYEFAFTIQGRITAGTNGVAGVTVNAGTQSTITDAGGSYKLHVPAGSHLVSPASASHIFSPSSQTVTVGPNAVNVNFTAVRVFSIAGRVIGGTGGLPGATVALGTNTVITDANGSYVFLGLAPGTYELAAVLAGYQFDPPALSLTVGPDVTDANFFAIFNLNGRVLDGTNGLSGVTVEADSQSAVTDSNGNYTILSLRAGTYFVFASLAGHVFEPPVREVVLETSTFGVDFAVAFRLSTLSGRLTREGEGLGGVRITTGGFGSALTDAEGNYSLGLPPGTYTVTPVAALTSFSPGSRIVSLPPDATGVDFVAGLVITSFTRSSDGLVRLSFLAEGGTTYQLEASTNLVDWNIISTTNVPTTRTVQFLDANAAGFPVRFYRLVEP